MTCSLCEYHGNYSCYPVTLYKDTVTYARNFDYCATGRGHWKETWYDTQKRIGKCWAFFVRFCVVVVKDKKKYCVLCGPIFLQKNKNHPSEIKDEP